MGHNLWSVFTNDLTHCYFTGSYFVERHHIFGGAFRKKSEIYGFIIPLRPDLHPNGVHFDEKNIYGVSDIMLKKMAQTYYEEHCGTRSQFRSIFGRSWL